MTHIILYFWCCSTVVFAQDVVEVETDISVDQIKASSIKAKSGIKPRAVYSEATNDNKVKPAAFKNVPSAVDRAMDAVKSDDPQKADDVEVVESEISEKNAVGDVVDSFKVKTIANPLTDTQVIEISSSLRKLIEENEGLRKELDGLDQQLKTVKGQQKLESNRVNEIAMERDALRKQNENIVALGAEAEKNRTQLQQQLTDKENEYSLRLVQLQTELASALQANSQGRSTDVIARNPEDVTKQSDLAMASPTTLAHKGLASLAMTNNGRAISVDVVSSPAAVSEEVRLRGERVLMALDNITKEQAKLFRDEAKLHYNMGNTYFNQGDYQKALAEYTRSAELVPEDANTHYNIAFVSGEFLNEPLLALQHYKMYLFLNPGAEDGQMVRQKIIDSEIEVKADVHFNSQINKEVKQKKNAFNDATQF